jgi:hypothetical protein
MAGDYGDYVEEKGKPHLILPRARADFNFCFKIKISKWDFQKVFPTGEI